MTRVSVARTSAGLAFAVLGVSLLAQPAPAERGAQDAPTEKQGRIEDRLVPIPNWSPDVADNGCPLRAAPIPFTPDGLQVPAEIPFWELIEHTVGRYSVRGILDPPAAFADRLRDLDPDMRTLVYLHTLWSGLGADGLHTYFFLSSGRNAPAVRNALLEAGFTVQHRLFTDAMALFGASYPADDAQRAERFGYASDTRQLNAFDHRLMALGAAFGTRADWTGIIVGYVNRTPALWRRIEAARQTLGEMARLEHLTDALVSRVDLWKPYAEVEATLSALGETQRTLLLLAAFNDQFENGGIHQVFYNAEGAIAPDVARALAGIGLERQAAILERGIAMFATPYPRDTQQRRETHFHNHEGWTGWDRRLSELTDAFYALDGGPLVLHIRGDRQIDGGPGLRHAMLAFARHHDMLPC
jgi:hypothetical protein